MGPAVIDVEVEGRMVRLGGADVREIGVLDSRRNGILIGLGAGLAAGLATGLLISQDGGNLRGPHRRPRDRDGRLCRSGLCGDHHVQAGRSQ